MDSTGKAWRVFLEGLLGNWASLTLAKNCLRTPFVVLVGEVGMLPEPKEAVQEDGPWQQLCSKTTIGSNKRIG